ncbi:MAG: F0F1 ATP synthase subunit B [Oscillospiraceae bacterium]|nr:F0F1 ATP synthase subunit B [Oscillospiraceae bacterium]
MFNIVLAAADVADQSRLFGLDRQTIYQICFQLFNVGLLAFVLSKILYNPVRNFMRKRSDRIQGELSHAADEATRAHQLKALYEQKLQEIDRERDGILDEARKKAVENGRQLLAEAKTEADAIRSRAQENVEMEWERIQAQMKLAILEVSAAMAEKMVALSVGKDVQERLFDETMAELEGTSWQG